MQFQRTEDAGAKKEYKEAHSWTLGHGHWVLGNSANMSAWLALVPRNPRKAR